MTDLLHGIRVLDASNVLAGPLCTYMLALSGAAIVKVEALSGDPTRRLGPDPALNARGLGASFIPQNAGKQSIAIDLKHPDGRALFRRLASQADVLVENFRPGVMRRLGLDDETLRGDNPGLVYCSISGFGQAGPWSDRPAYDHVVQGMAGGMTVSGDAATGPLKAGFQFCDTAAAMMAAYAITAALVRRARTGTGAYLDVAMLDTALFTLGWPVGHYLAAGAEPRAMGNHNFTGSPSGTFRTADGLLNVVTNTQRQFESLAFVLDSPGWCDDPRFATPASRIAHRDAMTEVLEAVLAGRSAEEWENLLAKAEVPAARVRTVPQILAEPQVTERGFVQHLDNGVAIPTAGFRLDDAPLRAASPPPALGHHTQDLLRTFGLSADEIAALLSSGAVAAAL